MDTARITEAFATWRARHVRPAWKPLTDDRGSSLSQFGGQPSSEPGTWPACGQCGSPMRLLLQLDLENLPAEFNGRLPDGLMQLFYCSVDDGRCDTWAPFSGAQEIVFSPKGRPPPAATPVTPVKLAPIQAWRRFEDTPDPEEHGSLGVHYEYDYEAKRVHVTCDDPRIRLQNLDMALNVAECVSAAALGDKLGGWPYWIQGVEYPKCTECGTVMNLLVQIDSDDHLPYMFGDRGCAHLTYCPNHPRIMAFGWACG
jgi:uncharacterized protein DUF1963